MELLLLIGRILFGGFFIMSGINHFMKVGMISGYAGSKNVPAPGLAVMGTGVMLVLGGLSVLLGFLPVLGLLLLILFLIPTSFLMHNFWTISDPMQRAAEQVNFLKNIALTGAALALMYGAADWPLSLS
ncbi:MAG TPA: DoxX family membrane protein [Rubrobacteraceae bacterium]|nr:DoxX family membrane protein [Rubrobacteraceae bacterium]